MVIRIVYEMECGKKCHWRSGPSGRPSYSPDVCRDALPQRVHGNNQYVEFVYRSVQ